MNAPPPKPGMRYGNWLSQTAYLYPKYDAYRLRGDRTWTRLLLKTKMISPAQIRGFNYRGYYATRRFRRRRSRRYRRRRFYRRRRSYRRRKFYRRRR